MKHSFFFSSIAIVLPIKKTILVLMSRIADDILANIDIVDVVSRYVQLKKT